MKTEKRIRDRLQKAYEVLAYYWGYLPEHFPEEYLSPEWRLPLPAQAGMIVHREMAGEKYGLPLPRNVVEAAKGFNEAITACVMLEWVLDTDSPLAAKGD